MASPLARRFHSSGLDPRRRSVSVCGTGVTACHNVLAMRLAGFTEPQLSRGSWSDWSTEGFQVATGADPGDPPD